MEMRRLIPETPVERTEYCRAQDRARGAIRRAISTGKLANLKAECVMCSACGLRRAVIYDHRDYSKPLEVTPVCRNCNGKLGPVDSIPPLSKEELRQIRGHRVY
jgi:hypothetical protein